MKKSYEKMTRTERKVAIAKDVIANIYARRMKISDGSAYLYVPPEYRRVVQTETDLKKIIRKCTVCARGAMMLTKLEKTPQELNIIDFRSGYAGQYHTEEVLADAFNQRELELIEIAFELTGCHCDINHNDKLVDKCIEFGSDHDHPDDRLMAIMQNIIDHDGKFKPQVRYIIKNA